MVYEQLSKAYTHSDFDFLMYDENIPLPREVAHDEWAGIYATVRVQFVDDVEYTSSGQKRLRTA